jgi:adhesin/invasin
LTNNPGTAKKLVFLNPPSSSNTAVAGQSLSSFQVAIEDANGNVDTSDSNPVSISLSSGTLIGTTSVNTVNGIATFSGVSTELAGANTLQASDSADSGVSSITTAIAILPGSPATLSVVGGSGQSATVGGAYGTALQVKLTDAYGNPISGASVTYSAPTSGASVSFTGNPATTGLSGQASVSATASTTAGAVTVAASADGLTTSFSLTNNPGAPNKLVFLNAPPSTNSAIAGSALSPFEVAIEDNKGNIVAGDTNVVSISLSTGTLTGTSSVKAVGGVAAFSGLDTELAGSNVLQANDSSDSLSQITTPITIDAGIPAVLSVVGSGQSAPVGSGYSPLQIKLTDAYGNPVSGATVTFSAPSSGATVSFTGNPATTDGSGDASVVATANSIAGVVNVTATSGSLSTTFQLTNSPGQPSKLVFLNAPPSSNTADAGQTLPAFEVAIEDSNNNVVTSDSSTVSVSLASGVLSGETSAEAVNGVATFSSLNTELAGANTLLVNDSGDGLSQISTAIVVNPGSPAILSVAGGSGQSGVVGDAYGTPLQVKLTDAFGNPISGASITFTAPGSGASVALSGSPATTNGSGVASVNATANTKAGGVAVTAADGALSTSFGLTNIAGTPRKLVFLTTPPNSNTAIAGGALPGFQVAIEDSDNNIVTGDSNAVSVSLSSGSLTGAVSVGAVNGLASFSGLTTATAGADSLLVNDSADSLTQISTPISLNPGSPAILGVVGGSGQTADVGGAYGAALQVKLTDAFGNPISGASVSFAAPTTGASVAFSGNPATTNSSGLASVTAMANNYAGGPFTVTAVAAGLSALFQLTNTPGTPSKLVFLSTPPSTNTATAGQALPSFQVAIEDSHGNVATGDDNTVTISLSDGSLAGAASVSANNGIATFSGLSTQTSGANALQANDSGDANVPQISTPISINPGSGDVLTAISGSGQSAVVGAAFATPLQVKFTDAFGNPISGASVMFSAPGSGATGSFSGNATVTTDASGVATAPSFTAGHVAGGYTVTASIGSLAAGFALTNTPNVAARLVGISGSSQNTVIGKSFATPLEVQVTDSFGNPVGGVGVTFAAPTAGVTGVFNAPAVVLTNAQGIATAPTLTASSLPGSFTVSATAAGAAGAASFALTNTAVPMSIAVSSGSGQKAAVNSQFASPLQALVLGSSKKPVVGITVMFTVSSGGPGGVFAGAASAVTNASGIAVSPALIANAAAGGFTVQASVAGVSTAAKFTLTNTAAAPASVSISSGNQQSAVAGKTLAKPLAALVLDSFGNPVSGVTVTFTAPGTAASGAFAKKSTVTAVTNSSGVATAPAFTANATTGSYTVAASVAGVHTPASFNLSNVSVAPAKSKANAGASQAAAVGQAFGTPLQLLVTDSHGNPIGGVWVTFTVPATAASGTFGGSTTVSVQTNASGIATAPTLTANTVAGNFAATATVSGLTGSVLFPLTNQPGAPAAVSIAAGGGQSAAPGANFAVPLVVVVTDGSGNVLSGVTVTFTVVANAGAGGAFGGGQTMATAVTNAQGIAIAPVLAANDVAGSFTVDASITGAPDAVFTLTNL